MHRDGVYFVDFFNLTPLIPLLYFATKDEVYLLPMISSFFSQTFHHSFVPIGCCLDTRFEKPKCNFQVLLLFQELIEKLFLIVEIFFFLYDYVVSYQVFLSTFSKTK
jgi:hypothetical protein